jgi:hypothetical protein
VLGPLIEFLLSCSALGGYVIYYVKRARTWAPISVDVLCWPVHTALKTYPHYQPSFTGRGNLKRCHKWNSTGNFVNMGFVDGFNLVVKDVMWSEVQRMEVT